MLKRAITVKRRIVSRPELRGTGLRVYIALLKKGEGGSGPRTIQKELGLSSPSLATYHLEQLINMGLAEKDFSGNYRLKKERSAEILSNFVNLFGVLLPKYILYSVFYTTMLITYVVIYPFRPIASVEYTVSLLFGISICVLMWYEAINTWIKRPF